MTDYKEIRNKSDQEIIDWYKTMVNSSKINLTNEEIILCYALLLELNMRCYIVQPGTCTPLIMKVNIDGY